MIKNGALVEAHQVRLLKVTVKQAQIFFSGTAQPSPGRRSATLLMLSARVENSYTKEKNMTTCLTLTFKTACLR